MPTYTGTITVELPFEVTVEDDIDAVPSVENYLRIAALEHNNCPSDAVVLDMSIDELDDDYEEDIDADEEDLLDEEE